MSTVTMIVGLPASGKGRFTRTLYNTEILNRDQAGGKVADLVAPMIAAISDDKDIVLDNLNITVADRKPFLDACRIRNVPVHCMWMQAKAEDCQINALMRMHNRYGQVFLHPSDIVAHDKAKVDPNMFPIAAIFSAKKRFEKPTSAEGFASITKVPFVREWPNDYEFKALFLDYDQTLREVVNSGEYKYPVRPSEVGLMSNVREVLDEYIAKGYRLFGVSNQSGVAKGKLTQDDAIACFKRTNELIGLDIPVAFCPHTVPPVCYCRKTQSGLFIPFIVDNKIDVSQSIMVGDSTSDKTSAKRLGMDFQYAEDFFRRK